MITPDTNGYRTPGSPALSMGLTSLTGGTTRPWPVTVLYALVSGDDGRFFLQFVLATVAWALLVWTAGTTLAVRHTDVPAAAWLSSALLVVLALSPGTAAWDVVLLAESFALSLVALAAAGLILVGARRGGLASAALVVVAVVLLAIVRPVFVPLAVLAAAVIGGSALRRKRRLAWATVAALLIGGAGYAVWYNGRVDFAWGEETGVPQLRGRTVQQYSILAASPSGPEALRRAVVDGAPSCIGPESYVEPSAWDWWHARLTDCPAGIRWISDESRQWFGRELLQDPGFARRYFRDALSEVGTQRTDGLSQLPSPVPDSLTGLFFSSARGVDPIAGWMLAAIALVAVQKPRRSGNRRVPASDGGIPLLAMLAISLLGAVAAVIATALASALDLARVGVAPATFLRIVLVVAVADLAALVRSRTLAPHPDDAHATRMRR